MDARGLDADHERRRRSRGSCSRARPASGPPPRAASARGSPPASCVSSASRSAARDRAVRVGRAARAPGAGLRSDPSRDGIGLAERHARLGAGGAGGDERLGLRATGSRRREAGARAAPRSLPPPTTTRAGDAACTLVLGLGKRQPAEGIRRDRRGLGSRASSDGDQLPARSSQMRTASAIAAGACERCQLRLGAQSCRTEPDAKLGGLTERAPSPSCPRRQPRHPSSGAPRARAPQGGRRRSRARGRGEGSHELRRGGHALRRIGLDRSRGRLGCRAACTGSWR